ncbi:hypothetical protein OPV22_003032 [Ensete ventricosum]|uniref:SCP domain-containing protein n=1 Tax=Ensete ventricosum TaxID=4639 RepID=A0AAV8RZF0_ENSVE|nr:hypothetical protein OPV22_003032 [Ensete ventricosum]
MGGRCFFFFLLLSIPRASQQHRLHHHHARRSLAPHPAIGPPAPHPAISPLAPHPAIGPPAPHPSITPLAPRPAMSPLAPHPAIGPPAPHPAISPLAPHPAATAPSGEGQDPDTANEFLSSHNEVRATIGEPPFVWDEALAEYARRWSDLRRSDCTMEHSQGPYGENLFWGSGQDWKAADAVKTWAAERDNYNSSDNSCAPEKMCGHFTQIVWNSTARVGCARVECIAGAGVIVVCDYDPPGNWVGERPFNANS